MHLDLLEQLLIFFGRLHPVVVHFPIALIVVVALAEIGQCFTAKRNFEVQIQLLRLGAFSAVLAAALGWLNAQNQEFQGELVEILFLHRWGGVVSAVLSLMTWIWSIILRRGISTVTLVVYRILLFSTLAFVGISAHFGGLLVHGVDYYWPVDEQSPVLEEENSETKADQKSDETNKTIFSKIESSSAPVPVALDRKVDFIKDVHPILSKNCARCHGDGRSKGGLNMDSREDLLRGGKNGSVVEVGRSDRSKLIELVAGLEPKKIMPNKGRRLTAREISILRAWIDQGLKWDSEIKMDTTRIAKASTALTAISIPASDEANPIDAFMAEYYLANQISAPNLADDRKFIRRAFLDLWGLTPTDKEVGEFLGWPDLGRREILVDKLLENRTRYSAHWLSFWNDLLRNDYTGPGFLLGGRKEITNWLYHALYNNLPFNQFAKDLIEGKRAPARGFVNGIKWWRTGVVNANEEPAMQAAQNVAQVFMGVNLKCASCHDSFVDQWNLDDAYGMANAFAQKPLVTHECNVATEEVVPAKFLYPEIGSIAKGNFRSRRSALASLLTDPRNGRFSRTIVNRLWAVLFGGGLIEPIDELDHQSWNPKLLDWLADQFTRDGYDLNKLLKLIMTSKAYQSEAIAATEQVSSKFNFRGPFVRRLTIEQLIDSVARVAGMPPQAKPGDIERILTTTLSKSESPVQSIQSGNGQAPGKGAITEFQERPAQLLYKSGVLTGDSGFVKVSVDVKDKKSLWLIVVRRYSQKSSLERQREQFDSVARSDSGVVGELKKSLAKRRDDRDHNKKLKMQKAKVGQYHAVWKMPNIVLGDGKKLNLADPKEFSPELFYDVEGEGDQLTFKRDLSPEKLNDSRPQINGQDLRSQAFSAFYYDISSIEGERFEAEIGVVSDRGLSRPVEFWVLSDVEVRSSFLEATPFTLAMGRPRREQISSRRPKGLTPIQALELSAGPEFDQLISKSAQRILAKNDFNLEASIDYIYRHYLNRTLLESENQAISSLLDKQDRVAATADLLWSVVLLPEFQLIY